MLGEVRQTSLPVEECSQVVDLPCRQWLQLDSAGLAGPVLGMVGSLLLP